MAKTSSKHQLIRSDYRLLGLGLFSVALLLGVFSVLSPNLMVQNTSYRAEKTIKVEEFPVDLSQFQQTDSSFAAEATDSGSRDSLSPVNPGY